MKVKKRFYLDKIKLQVNKCAKPSFLGDDFINVTRHKPVKMPANIMEYKEVKWRVEVIKINGEKVYAHLEPKFKMTLFFQWGDFNQWYRLRLKIEPSEKGGDYNISRLENKPMEIQYRQEWN